MVFMRRAAVAALLLVLSGCGGGSSAPRQRTVTLAGYGGFAAQTITGTYSAAECTKDVHSFTREAKLLVAHAGPEASYPADLYYMDLRIPYADFVARGCGPAELGRALVHAMTRKDRRVLVDSVPAGMAQLVQDALAHAG
jgi:hypothetical protein